MSLRFVKTAVLTSTDGLDFSKEEAIESDEAKAVRLAQERAANKPLYQQLAEQKDKKQQEYDAMTKMIFAPPKAIDEEEAGFLRTLYEEKEDTERRKKEDELRQLEEFRAHRKSLDTGVPSVKETKPAPIISQPSSSNRTSFLIQKGVPTIKAFKRKQPPVEEASKAAKQRVESADKFPQKLPDQSDESNSTKVDTGLSSLDMLGGYGSDSDS